MSEPTGESETLEERLDREAGKRWSNVSLADPIADLLDEARAEVARLTAERDAAEARAARLEEAHAVLAAFARTAPGCLPERVQRAVDLAPWDGALYRALLNPEGGDHAE